MNIEKFRVVECNGKFEVHWGEVYKSISYISPYEAQQHCDMSNAILELRVAFLEQVKPGQQLEVSTELGDYQLTAVQTYSFGLSDYINLHYPEFAQSPDVMVCSYIHGLDVKYVSLEKYADLTFCYSVELLTVPVLAIPLAYFRCPVCFENRALGHTLLSRLVYRRDGWIQCTYCKYFYPIVNGQPIMMTDTCFGQPDGRNLK